jgi:hypothetical protein
VTCSATRIVTLTLRAEPSGRHLVLQADEVYSKHEKHETELSDQNSPMTTCAKLLIQRCFIKLHIRNRLSAAAQSVIRRREGGRD